MNFQEFGKGEYIHVSSRRNTFFLYRNSKDRVKRKKVLRNTTFEVETNFTVGDFAWLYLRNYGWCRFPIKDWKITKNIHPRYHQYCVEYAEERNKWLRGEKSRIHDEDFFYKPIHPDPLSDEKSGIYYNRD